LFFHRLGKFVVRFRYAILVGWLLLAVLTFLLPPHWNDVTLDGDFAFLPDDLPSVQATQVYRRAFPQREAKSQLVFAISREDEPLEDADLEFADRMASPLQNVQGVRLFQQAIEKNAGDVFLQTQDENTLKLVDYAIEAWEESSRLDPKNWHPVWNQAYAFQQLGEAGEAQRLWSQAVELNPPLEQEQLRLVPETPLDWNQYDVMTRFTPVRGEMLRSKDGHAVLIMVETRNEFSATDNIRLLEEAKNFLAEWKTRAKHLGLKQLDLGVTGNAAIGGEMLLAAKESIRNTEIYTVVLVIVILLLIYRAPLLLSVPMVSIAISLIVASWIVAVMTQVHHLPGMEWFDFKVFKTSRIFIVVIMFGAGTDFCLFLIGRFREELAIHKNLDWAIVKALGGVGEALTASALTTVVGLGMMFFADFEKYRNSGPAIGMCLLVTLASSLTLAPAILRVFGETLFWPMQAVDSAKRDAKSFQYGIWRRLASMICRFPLITLISVVLLLGLVGYESFINRIATGQAVPVSYDFFGDLGNDRITKQTSLRIRKHFPLGESGPITILAWNSKGGFEETDGKRVITQFSEAIFGTSPDIDRVFTSQQPLGERDQAVSFSAKGRKRMFLKNHRRTKDYYLSQDPKKRGNVALIRVVTNHNPFSVEAIDLMERIEDRLQATVGSMNEPWNGTEFYVLGTTASIRDLNRVTQQDQQRIEVSVIIAVFLVLLVILRRPWTCGYMIVSVLFTYYVTLGITEWFFRTVYADTYQALDWKVPLFLFVILAAVGQDYNVYLATRVFEEQKKRGGKAGLLRGIASTGGIITSCGLVMAGTFASMCMGSLLGIVEIGFALAVGVLLDTFVVRTVMLPCFLALMDRIQTATTHTKSLS